MDTDGSLNPDGKASFYTSGVPLLNSVKELVLSLGGSISIVTRDRTQEEAEASIDGRKIKATVPAHELSFTLPNEMNPFKLPRKADLFVARRAARRKSNVTTDVIKSVTLCGEEPVQCITVDSSEHLYITDDWIVTHNSRDDKMSGHLVGIKSNLRFLLDRKTERQTRRVEEAPSTVSDETFEEYFEIIELDEIQGASLHNVIFLVDEYQLLDVDTLKLTLSRLAIGSKIVLIGDHVGQTYGVNRSREGFKVLLQHIGKHPEMAFIRLDNIYRSPLAKLVEEIFR
jgi:hypothetical protein